MYIYIRHVFRLNLRRPNPASGKSMPSAPSGAIRRTQLILSHTGWVLKMNRARSITILIRGQSDGRDSFWAPIRCDSKWVATVDLPQRGADGPITPLVWKTTTAVDLVLKPAISFWTVVTPILRRRSPVDPRAGINPAPTPNRHAIWPIKG